MLSISSGPSYAAAFEDGADTTTKAVLAAYDRGGRDREDARIFVSGLEQGVLIANIAAK